MLKYGAQLISQARPGNEMLNHVQATRDILNIGQRGGQVCSQQPGAGAGHGPVDDAQETVFLRTR